MPAALKPMILVAAIAWGATPVWGAGMPEFGTKNFSPDAATPAYFSNESSAAEADPVDDGADAPARSFASAAPPYVDGATRRHHGRLAGDRAGAYAAAYARGHSHAGQPARADRSTQGRRADHASHSAARPRTASAGTAAAGKSHARHASVRLASRKG